MGVLVKQFLAQKHGVSGDKIYHVTIMPCYDKKLEASRDDFTDEFTEAKDVDCVITSSKYIFFKLTFLSSLSFLFFQNS